MVRGVWRWLSPAPSRSPGKKVKRILILGVNGFIGHHLSKRILATTDWQVFGMDMQNDRIEDVLEEPRFHFFEGDITINREWIEYHIRKCDTVLPLDSIATPKEGSSRVLTQFFGHIVRGEKINLVDGGRQKRAFTYIDDGIDALMSIIANKNGIASGKIFNIGNPKNNISVRELAETMVKLAHEYPEYDAAAKMVRIVKTTAERYYGRD